jgi:hypothetical protein
MRTLVGLILVAVVVVGGVSVYGESSVKNSVVGSIQVTSQIQTDSDGVPSEKLFLTVLPSDASSPMTAQFRDSWVNGVFNSRDLYAVAQQNNGKTCSVETAGYTFRPLSVLPAVTGIVCAKS